MFSENEVVLMVTCVLAVYIGLSVLWSRLINGLEEKKEYFTTSFRIEKGNKIFSFSEDYIYDGILCQMIISLWRSRTNGNFYVSRTFEFNGNKPLQEFVYVDRFKAKDIIEKNAPKELAASLIADWIEGGNRVL